MTSLDTLQQMYEEYKIKAQKVRSKASRFAGAFNLGDDPRRHPCHEDFYDSVGEWVEEFLRTDPSEAEVQEVTHWLLEAADANRDSDVYWYMYAAQGHAKSLIPQMRPEVCAELLDWYVDTYPELDWLPAQQEVVRLMRKQSGKDAKGTGKGLLGFLKKR